MFCNKCGTEVKEGTPFCPNCGNNLGVISEQQPVQQPVQQPQYQQPVYQETSTKKKRGKILLILAIVLVVLVGVIAALFFTVGQDILRNRVVEEADSLVDSEDYEDAIKIYEDVLKEDEEHDGAIKGIIDAYVGLVDVALDENEFDEAKDLAEDALDATDADEFEEYLEMLENGKIFDKKDRLIKQLEFDELGNVVSYMVPTYDDEGIEEKITYYDLDDIEIRTIQNEYDANGNIIMTYFFEEEGEYSNRSEEYDDNGNVIVWIEYDVDTGIPLWGEEYNSNGDLITEVYYDEFGLVSSIYEYDEYGYLTSDSIYFEDGSSTTTIYDDLGSILQVEDYKTDGSYRVREYNEYYAPTYDWLYNSNGELYCYLVYEYFTDGTLRYSYNNLDELLYLYDFDEYGFLLNLAKYSQNGNVFYVDEFDIYENNTRTYWYDTDGYCYEYYDYKYDNTGNKTSRLRYDYYTDELIDYIIYDYDSLGIEIGQTSYMPDGTTNWYTFIEYSYDGTKKYTYEYSGIHEYNGYSETQIDENGNEIRIDVYNDDDSLYFTIEREVDQDGNLVRYKEIDSYGDVYVDMYYEYDEFGYEMYFYNNTR